MMLSRWFDRSKALENKDAQVRLKFLGELTADKAEGLQERLLSALQRETVAEIRQALFPHIRRVELLLPLVATGDTLARETVDYIARHREPSLALCSAHPELARARLLISAEPTEINALLDLFTDPLQLIDLVIKARGGLRDRLLNHPLLKTESAYALMERQSRGHDKTLNRHAREQMDAIRNGDLTLQQLRDRGTTIADTVASLVRHDSASPAARETRRRQLVLLQQELQGLLAREAGVIGDLATLGAVRLPALGAGCFDGLDLAPPIRSPFADLLDAVPQPEVLLADAVDTSAADAALRAMQSGWQEYASLADPTTEEVARKAAIEARYASLSAALARLATLTWPTLPDLPATIPDHRTQDFWREIDNLDAVLARHLRSERALEWPAALGTPNVLVEARNARATVESQRSQLREQETGLLQQVTATLRQIEAALDAGQSRQANAELAAARKQLALISFQRSEDARQHLDVLQQRVRELKDWQTFATSPKRETLLEQMRSLIQAGLEPETLAHRIRQVRAEWNALGVPANRHEHDLRSEFEAAADQAFEPCRAFFAEQDRLRQQNLEQRQSLIDMLDQYLTATDWQTADYRAADTILHKARETWHDSFPLPRGDHKPINERFEALQQRLHDLIHQFYAGNSARKQALVDELKGMRDTVPVETQVEAAKRLQADWKGIGPGLRHLEQKLWREFREVCDAIFANRSREVEEIRATRNTLVAQAIEQNAELQTLIDTMTVASASPAILRDARSRFEAIGDLGRDGRAAIDDHRRLLRLGETRLAELAKQRRGARLAAIQMQDHAMDRVALDPGLAAATENLDPVFANRKPHTGDVEEALSEIALLAEIAAEKDSPAEARAQRMALQIGLMNSRASLPEPEEILKRWCLIAQKPDNDRVAALRQRCFAALEGLLNR